MTIHEYGADKEKVIVLIHPSVVMWGKSADWGFLKKPFLRMNTARKTYCIWRKSFVL
jgi:hypothetical protein